MPEVGEDRSGIERAPVYLNNAATSYPKPPGMAEEVAAWLHRVPRHPGRSGAAAEDILIRCREGLARLIGAKNPRRVVLCSGATKAANLVCHGLAPERGLVLTTALEHNAILRPLYRLARGDGFRMEIVPCDGEGRVREDRWREAVEKLSPGLAVLNHASNVTGAVNDAESLLGFARNRGCRTILDASQSIGLRALDVAELNADIVLFTGHKNLGGPAGTGGFYAGDGLQFDPLIVGGTGVRSELKTMPEEMPERFEAGTPADALFAGLCFSLQWRTVHPPDLKALESMTLRMDEGLRSLGAQVIGVQGPRLGIVSFRLPGWKIDEAGYVLDRSFGIVCRTGLHCAPLIHSCLGTAPEGTIRFSLSRFTTEAEVDEALKAVRMMIHEHPAH